MANFTETKTEDLIKQIENLKEERERTADCLARLEAELERRKQEVPLGVPADGEWYVNWIGKVDKDRYGFLESSVFNSFASEESAQKHAEMLLAWRKALVSNAKGEPIDIEALLPLMKKGYVAMDEDGEWYWYENKPVRGIEIWNPKGYIAKRFFHFNLKRAEDWRESLMESGL